MGDLTDCSEVCVWNEANIPNRSAHLYEARLSCTPEYLHDSATSAHVIEMAEDNVRRRLTDLLGPEVAERARSWWIVEPYPGHGGELQGLLPLKWDPVFQRGERFPRNVRRLICKAQVIDWYLRNPIIYGWPDRRHDWPDFRCERCDRLHEAPRYYCPYCGEVFYEHDVVCMHSLEENAPEQALVRPIKVPWRTS